MDKIAVARELVKVAKSLAAYREDWVISPDRLIYRAVMMRLISLDEAHSRAVKEAAQAEAESLRDSWPEGEGFGSSDGNASVRTMLRDAGIPVDWVGGRLTRTAKTAGGMDEIVIDPPTPIEAIHNIMSCLDDIERCIEYYKDLNLGHGPFWAKLNSASDHAKRAIKKLSKR